MSQQSPFLFGRLRWPLAPLALVAGRTAVIHLPPRRPSPLPQACSQQPPASDSQTGRVNSWRSSADRCAYPPAVHERAAVPGEAQAMGHLLPLHRDGSVDSYFNAHLIYGQRVLISHCGRPHFPHPFGQSLRPIPSTNTCHPIRVQPEDEFFQSVFFFPSVRRSLASTLDLANAGPIRSVKKFSIGRMLQKNLCFVSFPEGYANSCLCLFCYLPETTYVVVKSLECEFNTNSSTLSRHASLSLSAIAVFSVNHLGLMLSGVMTCYEQEKTSWFLRDYFS